MESRWNLEVIIIIIMQYRRGTTYVGYYFLKITSSKLKAG